jgi:hypothetical protein
MFWLDSPVVHDDAAPFSTRRSDRATLSSLVDLGQSPLPSNLNAFSVVPDRSEESEYL